VSGVVVVGVGGHGEQGGEDGGGDDDREGDPVHGGVCWILGARIRTRRLWHICAGNYMGVVHAVIPWGW